MKYYESYGKRFFERSIIVLKFNPCYCYENLNTVKFFKGNYNIHESVNPLTVTCMNWLVLWIYCELQDLVVFWRPLRLTWICESFDSHLHELVRPLNPLRATRSVSPLATTETYMNLLAVWQILDLHESVIPLIATGIYMNLFVLWPTPT